MIPTRYRAVLWFAVGVLAWMPTFADKSDSWEPGGRNAPNNNPSDGLSMAVPSFESLDRNRDNRLSRTEAGYNRLLSEIFASSDVDADGFVSRSEYGQATDSGAPGETLRRI